MNITEQILDLARWASSGDNIQPWRFEVMSESHVVIHLLGTRLNAYELDGTPLQLSIGGLLETLRIAASAHGLQARFERRRGVPDGRAMFDVWLEASSTAVAADPLHTHIKERSVQRKAFSARALTPLE